MKKTKGILWGLAVIALGIIWGLNQGGLINVHLFDGWWTLFIIVPSFISLITDKDKTGSLIGLCIGLVLLAGNYFDIWNYREYLLPLVVIIIGVVIIFNTVNTKKIKNDNSEFVMNETQVPVSETGQEYYASFTGQTYQFNNGFAGGKFSASFGALKLDIRNADIVDNCVVNTSATFGGVEILVPQNVRVIAKSNSVFGGTSDKSNKSLPADAKTIYINSTNLFGGTDIK